MRGTTKENWQVCVAHALALDALLISSLYISFCIFADAAGLDSWYKSLYHNDGTTKTTTNALGYSITYNYTSDIDSDDEVDDVEFDMKDGDEFRERGSRGSTSGLLPLL